MGQYHRLVCLENRECLQPKPLGAGSKAWEQYSSMAAPLIALISDNPGNMPADLGHHPLIGHWAGRAIAFYGDYAEAGDAPHPAPLDEIWSGMRSHMKARSPKIAGFC